MLQLGARLERLDAAVLALYLRVRPREQQRDVRADLVAEGGLGGGERGLGDEFVVLRVCVSGAACWA